MRIFIEANLVRAADGSLLAKATVRVPMEGPFSGKNVMQATALSPVLESNGASVGADRARFVDGRVIGPAKVDAVHKAAALVDQLAANPVLAALMPPGTALAVTIAKDTAHAIKTGNLGPVIDKYGGLASRSYHSIARLSHYLSL